MNIKKLSTLLVVLTLSLAAMAQNKIYFCDDVTDNGAPLGHSNTKAVIYPDEGGSLYVLFTSDKVVKDKEVNIKVELKNAKGAFEVVQNFKAETEPGKKWFTFDVPLDKIGDYKITVQTLAKTDLASGIVKVTKVVEEEEEEEAVANDEE